MLSSAFVIALAVLEIELFVIGPVFQSNVLYIAIRVATIFAFSFICVRSFKKNLYETLSLAGLLIFVDQVLFKSLWLVLEFQRNPKAWAGVDRTAALFSSAFSYIVFLPAVLILALLGVFAAYYLPKKPRTKGGQSEPQA